MRLPKPEAGHGACDTPPERAACGDFHDEFTLCGTCDVGRADHDRSPPRDVSLRHSGNVDANDRGVRLENRDA